MKIYTCRLIEQFEISLSLFVLTSADESRSAQQANCCENNNIDEEGISQVYNVNNIFFKLNI